MICVKNSTTSAKPMSVYLDHNATSPMHPQVVDAMLPFLQNSTGNPSSLHSYGRMARSAIESARAENVAGIVGLGKAAQLARFEIEQKQHHLEQLRDVFENRLAGILDMDNNLQDVEMLIVKLQELVNKLPTVIRQAAV